MTAVLDIEEQVALVLQVVVMQAVSCNVISGDS